MKLRLVGGVIKCIYKPCCIFELILCQESVYIFVVFCGGRVMGNAGIH